MKEASISSERLSASGRLAGIELMRGIAIFGVICLHAGLVVGNHTTPGAERLRVLCFFACPSFS